MKIAIVGCGYVGSAMARHWKTAGHEITVTTRYASRIPELESFSNHVVVLGSFNFLTEQDVVLIAVAPDRGGNYGETYLGTVKKVLPFVQGKHVIYISSTSIYGDHQGDWVDETNEPSPLNENTKILWQTEEVLPTQSCIFRLGEIVGPEREIIERLKKNSGPFPGTGNQYTNLSPLHLIVQGLDCALKNRLSGVYNLCTDDHPTRRELYDTLCDQHGLPRVEWDPSQVRMHGGNKRIVSKKFTNLLNH